LADDNARLSARGTDDTVPCGRQHTKPIRSNHMQPRLPTRGKTWSHAFVRAFGHIHNPTPTSYVDVDYRNANVQTQKLVCWRPFVAAALPLSSRRGLRSACTIRCSPRGFLAFVIQILLPQCYAETVTAKTSAVWRESRTLGIFCSSLSSLAPTSSDFTLFGSCCAPEIKFRCSGPYSISMHRSIERGTSSKVPDGTRNRAGARYWPRIDYGYSSVFGENFQVSPREGHEV
jgi:hypothetical protein